ncbi:hypothetical protein HDF11_004760 [Tunturiibacter psychrotolerans]
MATVGCCSLVGAPNVEGHAPYLPGGISISVATDSDDARQPMMFESAGGSSPIDWPIEKRGALQHSVGLGTVTEIRLAMPADVRSSRALKIIAQSHNPPLSIDPTGTYCLHLRIASLFAKPDLQIALPLIT